MGRIYTKSTKKYFVVFALPTLIAVFISFTLVILLIRVIKATNLFRAVFIEGEIVKRLNLKN